MTYSEFGWLIYHGYSREEIMAYYRERGWRKGEVLRLFYERGLHMGEGC